MKVCRAVFFATSLLTTITLVDSLSHAASDTPASSDLEWLIGISGVGTEVRITDNLGVNTDPSYRRVVPGKCQEQGESDLMRLAEQAPLEEAFVFIPSLCLWIETGYNETEKSVRLDTLLVAAILQRNPQIILYHLHPGRPSEVTGYFPAYSDLIGSVLIDAGYLGDPDIVISHRAITSHGLIDYAFVVTDKTERLVTKMQQTGLGSHVPQNLAYEFATGAHEQNYYAAIQDCVRLSGGVVENLSDCFPLQVDDFVLQYLERIN